MIGTLFTGRFEDYYKFIIINKNDCLLFKNNIFKIGKYKTFPEYGYWIEIKNNKAINPTFQADLNWYKKYKLL